MLWYLTSRFQFTWRLSHMWIWDHIGPPYYIFNKYKRAWAHNIKLVIYFGTFHLIQIGLWTIFMNLGDWAAVTHQPSIEFLKITKEWRYIS